MVVDLPDPVGPTMPGFIQQTGYDLFAVNSRQGGNTEVDVLVLHSDVEAAVLGNAVLRDVQTAHDLDAGNDAGLQITGDRHDIAHQTVDPHADLQFVLPRLQMDVTGAFGDGALNDGVYQADGGGVADVVLPQLVGNKGGVRYADFLRCGSFPFHFLDSLGSAFIAIKHLDSAIHGGRRSHHGNDLLADSLSNFLDRIEVHGVAHGQIKLILDRAHRHDLILLCNILRKSLRQLRGDIDLGQIHELDAQLHLQSFDQIAFGDEPMLLQHRAQALVRSLLQAKALFQLLLRDQTRGDQQIAHADIAFADALPLVTISKYRQNDPPLLSSSCSRRIPADY